jgi:hypothetical protein
MTNRPMSAKQYKAALADFKLSQSRAGWIFGGKSQNSGRLWPSEGAPYYVAVIISLMRIYNIPPGDIEEIGAVFRGKTPGDIEDIEPFIERQKRKTRKRKIAP